MKDEEIINIIIRHLCSLPFNKSSILWYSLKKETGLNIDNQETSRLFKYLADMNLCKIDFDNGFGKYNHPISLIDKTICDFNSYQEYMDKTKETQITNIHNETVMGDKIQDSSFGDFKPINNPSKADTTIQKSHIKEFLSTTTSKIIGTIIGGAVLWLLIQQVLIPCFNNH